MSTNLLPAKCSYLTRLFPVRMSTTQKVVFMSIAAGVSLLGIMSRYLRRRKSQRPYRRTGASARSGSSVVTCSQSDRLSVISGFTGPADLASINHHDRQSENNATQLTPQQLGVMGIEALDTVINFWEDALAADYSTLANNNESEFCREIRNLLHISYKLQEKGELLFLDERSVLFREESNVEEIIEETGIIHTEMINEEDRQSCHSVDISRSVSDSNFDSADSYASASDLVVDVAEFNGFNEILLYDEYPLYQEAIMNNEESPTVCRTIHTQLLHCANDNEYLAKLHCVRLAFQYLFQDPAIYQWVTDTGRQILSDLLFLGNKDIKEFLMCYEDMINYLQDPINWDDIEKELEHHNVKAMTFYDICVDFLIRESFCDLDAPPANVKAVVQNRFLSKGFKETALTNAICSVLNDKKEMLQYPNGFMSHFYAISEQLYPLFAWGFFGPDRRLRDICYYFRDQLLTFQEDIFDFQKTHYTTLERLSLDILEHMKIRVNNISIKFSQ
uniref:Mitoguardin n=1 Tax=Glossina brevipalpis TaxID=37001 RepID=A0A1A9WDD7_9MUSC